MMDAKILGVIGAVLASSVVASNVSAQTIGIGFTVPDVCELTSVVATDGASAVATDGDATVVADVVVNCSLSIADFTFTSGNGGLSDGELVIPYLGSIQLGSSAGFTVNSTVPQTVAVSTQDDAGLLVENGTVSVTPDFTDISGADLSAGATYADSLTITVGPAS